ncbi:hypothetical protein [Nocardia brasiliensis]|uniref:hypothetical protein n=1 Tax=Nocardia brasiliensis TaxID=37326 RepID=UPI0018958F39|nr:hypothetical protein [Nocardia brasiliensis]MBF6126602.1 hypothetical protein [Nocardia brasiliensis]
MTVQTRRPLSQGLPGNGEATFRSRFMGLAEPPDRLLLTPVGFLARPLGDGGVELPGLWPAHSVEGVPVVVGPQGRPVVDCVFAMPPGSAVIFVGLAGGLRSPAKVGRWVRVEQAWDGNAWHRATFEPVPELPPVRAATVGSLTESWSQTESLRERADVVDLETSHVLAVAAARGVRAASLLLVSDEPPHKPFWDTDLAALAPAADALATALRQWRRDGGAIG